MIQVFAMVAIAAVGMVLQHQNTEKSIQAQKDLETKRQNMVEEQQARHGRIRLSNIMAQVSLQSSHMRIEKNVLNKAHRHDQSIKGGNSRYVVAKEAAQEALDRRIRHRGRPVMPINRQVRRV